MVGDTATPSSPPLFGDAIRYELLCRRHFNLGEESATVVTSVVRTVSPTRTAGA